jgi:hypothetical protein
MADVKVPKAMISRLLRLSRELAEQMEAEKNRAVHADYLEVKLLKQVEAVENLLGDTLNTRSSKR